MRLRLIFLICTLICSSFVAKGQVVTKKTFFNAHALAICKDTTELSAFHLDKETKSLKVYSFTGTRGALKIEGGETKEEAKPEGKEGRSKAGNLMKKMQDMDAKMNPKTTGPIGNIPSAGCIVERIIPLDKLESMDNFEANTKDALRFYDLRLVTLFNQMNHTMVLPLVKEENKKYSYKPSADNCTTRQINLAELPQVDLKELGNMYPHLQLNTKKQVFKLATDGDGLTKMKNSGAFVELTTLENGIDPMEMHLTTYASDVSYPNKEVAFKATGGLVPLYAQESFTEVKLNDKEGFRLLGKKIEDDKWSWYQNYALIKYSTAGEIISRVDFMTPFLKQPTSMQFAYNEAGEIKGLLVILSSFIAIGAKDRKDPEDNNHEVVYFDLNGKIRFQKTVKYGEGDNPRALNPVFIIETPEGLRFLNANYAKILKPVTEEVFMSFDGKYETKQSELSYYRTQIMMHANSVQMLPDGNFLITNGKKAVDPTNANNCGIIIMKPNFEVIYSYLWQNKESEDHQIDFLGNENGKPKFVITGKSQNWFLHMVAPGKDGNKVLGFPGETDFAVSVPQHPIGGRNYIYDSESRTVYAFYTGKTGNGLGYVVKIDMN